MKYSIDDPNFVIQRRRNDAYKKMYQSCGGPYVIVSEGAAEEWASHRDHHAVGLEQQRGVRDEGSGTRPGDSFFVPRGRPATHRVIVTR